MIAPVVLASVLFDRGSGFLAAALGGGGAASLMDWRVLSGGDVRPGIAVFDWLLVPSG
jgi:hypothetical protein